VLEAGREIGKAAGASGEAGDARRRFHGDRVACYSPQVAALAGLAWPVFGLHLLFMTDAEAAVTLASRLCE